MNTTFARPSLSPGSAPAAKIAGHQTVDRRHVGGRVPVGMPMRVVKDIVVEGEATAIGV